MTGHFNNSGKPGLKGGASSIPSEAESSQPDDSINIPSPGEFVRMAAFGSKLQSRFAKYGGALPSRRYIAIRLPSMFDNACQIRRLFYSCLNS
jgi:hypothetical protein